MRLNVYLKKIMILAIALLISFANLKNGVIDIFAANGARSTYIDIGGAQCYFDVQIQGNTITLIGNSTKLMEADCEVIVDLAGTMVPFQESFGNTYGFNKTYTFSQNVSSVQVKYTVAVEEEVKICTVSASVN